MIDPGLKEQASKLSDVLLHKRDTKFPPQKLVLDKLTSNPLSELRNRPLEELFQVANDPVDSSPAKAVVSPSFDQVYANN